MGFLDHLPTRHPREKIIIKAENKLRKALLAAVDGLTTAEDIRVTTTVLSEHLNSIAKYAIRLERHGDCNKPGGLA